MPPPRHPAAFGFALLPAALLAAAGAGRGAGGEEAADWLTPAEVADLRDLVAIPFSAADVDPGTTAQCLAEIIRMVDDGFKTAKTTKVEGLWKLEIVRRLGGWHSFREALQSPDHGVTPADAKKAQEEVRTGMRKALGLEGGLSYWTRTGGNPSRPEPCKAFGDTDLESALQLVVQALGKAFLKGHSTADWRRLPANLYVKIIFAVLVAVGIIYAVWRDYRKRGRRFFSDPLTLGKLRRVPGGLLGSGAHGEVWHAQWCGSDGKAVVTDDGTADCALKMVKLGKRGKLDMDEMNATVQELMVVTKLGNHPYIVSAEDFFVHQERTTDQIYACIVMELCEGGTLRSLVKKYSNGLEPSRVLRYLAQLLEALDFAHTHQLQPVIHRDIKPENVLMDFKDSKDGDCRLTDFGLSFTCRTQQGWEDDDEAYAVGTRLYMAPEWFGNADEQIAAKSSPAADVWSLGCVVWECAMGVDVPTAEAPASSASRRSLVLGRLCRSRNDAPFHELIPRLRAHLGLPPDPPPPAPCGGDRSPPCSARTEPCSARGLGKQEHIARCAGRMLLVNPAGRASAKELRADLPRHAAGRRPDRQLRRPSLGSPTRRLGDSAGRLMKQVGGVLGLTPAPPATPAAGASTRSMSPAESDCSAAPPAAPLLAALRDHLPEHALRAGDDGTVRCYLGLCCDIANSAARQRSTAAGDAPALDSPDSPGPSASQLHSALSGGSQRTLRTAALSAESPGPSASQRASAEGRRATAPQQLGSQVRLRPSAHSGAAREPE